VQRGPTGEYVTTTAGGGEPVRVFVPAPLPLHPPVDIDAALRDRLHAALLALGRLDSVTTLLPDTHLLLYMLGGTSTFAACAGTLASEVWTPRCCRPWVAVIGGATRARSVTCARGATMNTEHVANCARLVQLFEGREGIYLEKGITRVRVFDLDAEVPRRYVSAQVEELPTPELRCRPGLGSPEDAARPPRRWEIGAGYLSTFCEHYWDVGYGGWSLFFSPSVIDTVIRRARELPADLSPHEQYTAILMDYLNWVRPCGDSPPARVFPDASDGKAGSDGG
jgi:hypothetical protein